MSICEEDCNRMSPTYQRWYELVEKWSRWRRFQGPWVEPEDLRQDVIAVAAKKEDDLEDPEDIKQVKPWLMQIMEHVFSNHRRKVRWQRQSNDEMPEVPSSGRSPEEEVYTTQVRAQLHQALQSLPQADRELIQKSHLDEIPHKALAAQLNIPVGTLKSRLHTARGRLKGKLPRHLLVPLLFLLSIGLLWKGSTTPEVRGLLPFRLPEIQTPPEDVGPKVELRTSLYRSGSIQPIRHGQAFAKGDRVAFRVYTNQDASLSLQVNGPEGRENLARLHLLAGQPRDVADEQGWVVYRFEKKGRYTFTLSPDGANTCTPPRCDQITLEVR